MPRTTGGTAVFRVQHVTGRRRAREMGRAARKIRREVFIQMKARSWELEEVFRRAAPYDEDEDVDQIHLADELEAPMSFPRGRIAINIRSPVRGMGGPTWAPYPYTGVTRFGHVGPIRPRFRKVLRWVRGGETFFATEAAGHHPPSDWVADAAPAARKVSKEIAERVGRVVFTRVLS